MSEKTTKFDSLQEVLDWAFGRKPDCLNQVVYMDAVSEVERLARLGAAVEAGSKKTGGMHTNSGKVYFNTSKNRAKLALRILESADTSRLSAGEQTMLNLFICEYREACNHGN